jgi:dGTPase
MFERVYLGRVGPATKDAVEHILRTLLEHHEAEPMDGASDGDAKIRAVDYVAGMTDRFALRAFERVVGGPPPGLGMGALG